MNNQTLFVSIRRYMDKLTDGKGPFAFQKHEASLVPSGNTNEEVDASIRDAKLIYDLAVYKEVAKFCDARRKELEATVASRCADKIASLEPGATYALMSGDIGTVSLKLANGSKRLDKSLLRQALMNEGMTSDKVDAIIDSSSKQSSPSKTFEAVVAV